MIERWSDDTGHGMWYLGPGKPSTDWGVIAMDETLQAWIERQYRERPGLEQTIDAQVEEMEKEQEMWDAMRKREWVDGYKAGYEAGKRASHEIPM